MTRILLFVQNYPPEKTGGASRLGDMTYHLQREGAEVTVVCPHPTFPFGNFPRVWKPIVHEKREDGISVVHLWSWQPSGDSPGTLSKIWYYLTFPLSSTVWLLGNVAKYDVIITSTPPLFVHIPGYIVKRLFGVKWIAEFRDLWVDASIDLGFLKKGSLIEKLSRMFQSRCLTYADKIAVTTHEMGRRLVTKDAEKRKLLLVPNGVDTEVFTPVQFEEKVDQIIFAGNIGYAQDLVCVIRSLKIIRKEYPLVLNLVGSGELVPQLKAVAKEEGVEDAVLFTGLVERSEVPRLVSHAKLVTSPLKNLAALEYAAPIKTYEALACGTPFVACGKGEIAELADASGAGVIAENTPEEYAAAVLSLLHDPKRMIAMAESGRRFVEKNYDRKAIAQDLLREAEAL